nr:hypothetical protein [Tanacetum cinerariifolium]
MVVTGDEEEIGNSKNQRGIYTLGVVNAQSSKMMTRVKHYINQRMRFKISRRDATWITDTKSCQSENESFGVDAAMVIKEKHQVFTAASEDISAARKKLMLLVTAAK